MDSTDNIMKTKKEVYAALQPSNNLMKISARHFCFLSKALLRLPVLIYPIIFFFFFSHVPSPESSAFLENSPLGLNLQSSLSKPKPSSGQTTLL